MLFNSKFQFACLAIIVCQQITLDNALVFSKLNHRLDLKSPEQIIAKNHIYVELRMFESKIMKGKFNDSDLRSLFKLIDYLKKQSEAIVTPKVYWYSRQGR